MRERGRSSADRIDDNVHVCAHWERCDDGHIATGALAGGWLERLYSGRVADDHTNLSGFRDGIFICVNFRNVKAADNADQFLIVQYVKAVLIMGGHHLRRLFDC